MQYFFSTEFYETLIAIVITVIVVGFVRTFENRHKLNNIKNKSWYRSAKMVRDIFVTIFVIIMILIVLSINGINVGKYFASLGILGIILSFALQDLLKDLIMGVTIIFEGYFKTGDVIEYDGMVGKVKSINLKTTKIFLLDTEATLSICNRYLDKVAVASDWVDINVPIGYDIDLYYSRAIVRECAKRIERLRYVYSCDFLNTSELEESWVNYRLRIHCLPEKKPPVKRAALAVVQDVFYEHNAEFPLSIKVLYQQEVSNNPKTIEHIVDSNGASDSIIDVIKKKDYEYGHGAAESKVIKISKDNSSYEKVVNEAERYAASENLSKKMRLRIRLLSEELMSMIQKIPQIDQGSFHIERDGADYDICFESSSKIDAKYAKNLISVSTSGGNDAYSGFSGLVAKAIDSMVMMSRDGKNDEKNFANKSIVSGNDEYRWSYNIYKETENEDDEKHDDSVKAEIVDWTEIERSVLTKMSDDIKIFVRSNQINIRVLVKGDESE